MGNQNNPVLTEWQEKKLKDTFFKYWPIGGDIHDIDVMVEYVKIVLSEPEPPKYIPKQGEAVLVRGNPPQKWMAGVFDRIEGGKWYYCFHEPSVGYANCIPFDIDLIGTTDNPKF